MSMKVQGNIVYMRPAEWRHVIPHITDRSIVESLAVGTYGNKYFTDDADCAYGGLKKSQIEEISDIYRRLFAAESEAIAA